jgi:co-chaperonin GroES (HSP10)
MPREYNKNLEARGERVVIKRIDINHERKFGDIIIPDSTDKGYRAAKGVVISIGPDIESSEGIKVGDTILYDEYSVFYDVSPIVITNYENIICRVEED